MISKGNHAKFARFVLLAISEEAKTFFFSFNVLLILDSVFVISRIIKVSVRVIPYPNLDLDYSGYYKTLIQ